MGEAVKKIMRGLMVGDDSEYLPALRNYRSTSFGGITYTAVEEVVFNKIQDSVIQYGGCPKISTLLADLGDPENASAKLTVQEASLEPFLQETSYQRELVLLREHQSSEELTVVLADLQQIQQFGKVDKKGVRHKGVRVALQEGFEGLSRISQKANPLQAEVSPEQAIENLAQEYKERALNPLLSYGLGWGIRQVDEATRGAQAKELWIIAGFTSAGKSTAALNWARYLACEGEFNILFYSLEMPVEQCYRILACIHAASPKFGRMLSYKKVKSGSLSPDDADFYLNQVLPDLRNNPRLIVRNPKGKTTIEDIQMEAELIHRENELDAVFIDYLGILPPPRDFGKGGLKRDFLNENIIRAKRLATDFSYGQGIAVVSAHQINRQGYKRAMENAGRYDIEAIADANEAERSSDVLMAIYSDDTLKQQKEVVWTMLKNRDGEVIQPFNTFMSVEHRVMGELSSATADFSEGLLG